MTLVVGVCQPFVFPFSRHSIGYEIDSAFI
jgi:hypothetical protein